MAGTGRRTRNLGLALAVSLGAHLVVLGLLVPNAPVDRTPRRPVFEIELLPPAAPEPASKARSRSAASKPTPGPQLTPPGAESAEVAQPAGLANVHQPAASAEGSVVPFQLGGARGPALDPGDGCEPRRLASARERRECEVRQMAMARLRPPPDVEDDLSKGGRFSPPDPLPYLARAPKKGCKPKVGGGSGIGEQDVPVIGLACVFHF